ncbi:amino acid ABC transporter permease [Pseudogracilibacillus sp. SO30301A]|uniref:amino acid ABC transporter permease n=1 Tax=Pseudogracilibacillus sp. SO30301A TaxID=3098291 RepID=UPI00300DCB72
MEKYFDVKYVWAAFPELLPFLKVTFFVMGLAVLFGTVFGLLLAFAKMGNNKYFRFFANGYTTIMRCTPSIVLLFLVYYGVPAFSEALFGLNLQDIHTGVYVVITFTLQFAAMMSEVLRSAIESVDHGQYEAAVSVGLTPLQAYVRIVFPQAFVVALPNFGNGLIAILQEGALAYTIGFVDIVGKANLIIASNYGTHTLEVFIALAVIYWVLAIVIEKIFAKFEQIFSKGSRSLKTS